MLRIGLTGGIGSGKSTVAALFAEHKVPIIDADAIAHRLTLPGTATTSRILQEFGSEIADSEGGIDRQQLARLIFDNSDKRAQLERILHPQILSEMRSQQESLDAPYCLLVIPLLFEAGQRDVVDRTLVVDASEELQISRVAARDNRSEAEIRSIIATQIGRTQRLNLADDRISNSGDLSDLRAQVVSMHRKYIDLARKKSRGR